MSELPETVAFRVFLARAVRRAQARAALRGAAAGLLGAAAIAATTSGAVSALVAVAVVAAGAIVGAAVGVVAGRHSLERIAVALEHRAPASRNLILTAAELAGGRITAAPAAASRVYRDAAALVGRLDLSLLIPLRRAIAVATTAAIASVAIAVVSAGRPDAGPEGAQPSSGTAARLLGVDVEVTPPEYTARPSILHRDPSRIEALAGSRVRVTVRADAAGVTLDTIARSSPLSAQGPRTFSGDVMADADGYIAVAPVSAEGGTGARRLIGLSVLRDESPRVRITAPGRDLLFAHGKQQLQVMLEAEDDLALGSLGMKYTRIAGSGESFTFTEGAVNIAVTPAGDRRWQGRAAWSLAPLNLEPGDMVIYRGVASDKRPGAPAAESDPFIVEIAAGGSLPSEGFAIDDRENKYAISQQMVIVRTERLLAARASIPSDEYRSQSADIAAEQRQVRAEFVFMMGGELADAGVDLHSLGEEVEAEGESDLAAGRLANQGRMDLLRAIRAMSRAAARLADPDPAAALPIEKEALGYLQRAFSRSRYILRTLGERERLDLSRRLTGTLAALSRETRPAAEPSADARVSRIRRVLADVASLAVDLENDAKFSERAVSLAQAVLQIDPSSGPIRDAAAALTDAGASSAHARVAALDRAATTLAAMARAALGRDSARDANPELDALAGALADALRRQGGKR
jgi:hypothetical protein